MGLEVIRCARTRRAMAAMVMLSAISMASPASADSFDTALRQYAQAINEHGVKPGGTVSASVDGRIFTLNVVSKSAITPERIQQLGVREQVCSDLAVRAAMAETTFVVRVVVSAPNLPAPVVTPVKSADCDAIAAHTQATRSSIPASGTPAATGSHTAASAGTGAGRPFDFKGVPLGISYDDFRRLPHPDGTQARVECTDDRVTEAPDMTTSDATVKELGIRRCLWVYSAGGNNAEGGEVPLGFAGTVYRTVHYSFVFVPDPADGVLRLFRFQAVSIDSAQPTVVDALTAKYGKPKITSDTVQNGLGNSFKRVTAEWSNAAGSITVVTPVTTVSDMEIVMIDKRLLRFVDAAKAAKRAAIHNGI